jgi:hypothetical protein
VVLSALGFAVETDMAVINVNGVFVVGLPDDVIQDYLQKQVYYYIPSDGFSHR